KNVDNLTEATTTSLLIAALPDAIPVSYCVVVSGPCNQVTNCATLTVKVPLTAAGPVNQTNCPGDNVTFTTVASGAGPFTYQWSKNADNLAGATNSSLLLADITAASAGTYCVVISGPCNQ